MQPGRSLRLRARAWPAGEAEVHITLRPGRRRHRGRDRARTRSPGPARWCPKPLRGRAAEAGATSRPCAGWPTSSRTRAPVSATTRSWSAPAPTGWSRPTGWPTPAGRCWCWRPQPEVGGAVAQRPGRRPGLRPRHLQRVLPARRRLAGDPVLRPRAARPALAARARGARPPAAATATGRCCTATGTSPPRLLDGSTPATARPGSSSAPQWDRDRRAARRRPAHAVPAGAARARPAGPAARGRRPGLRADAAHPGRRARRRAGSAATAPRLLLAGNAGPRRHPAGRARLRADGPADDDARPDRRLPGPRGRRRRARRGPGPAARAPRRRDPLLGTGSIAIEVDRGRATGVRTADGSGTARAGPWSPTSPRRTSTAGCVAADDLPDRVVRADARLPARPRHGQGRLGARRPGAVGGRPRRTPPAPCTSPTPWRR